MSSYRDSDKPRERKSWREIDKARESGQRRESREDRERNGGHLGADKTAYEKYKRNLDKLWNSGQLSELIEQKANNGAAAPPAQEGQEPQRAVIRQPNEEAKKEKEARQALVKAVTPMEVKQAVANYLAIRPSLPGDLEILSKTLLSPTEAHQQAALRALDARTDLNTTQSQRLIKTRLQTVLLTASDDETKQLAASVKAKLG